MYKMVLEIETLAEGFHTLARTQNPDLCPRGKKHGKAQWHRDHWKAMDADEEHGNTIRAPLFRWQEDEKYRNSRQHHGWPEEYCQYLDYFATIDISNTAPWHQRHWYESTITLVCNDDGREAGETLDASSSTEDRTQECMAATAARHI